MSNLVKSQAGELATSPQINNNNLAATEEQAKELVIAAGNKLQQLIQGTPAIRFQVMREFRNFIEGNGLSRAAVIAMLSAASEGYHSEWLNFFDKFEKGPGGFQVIPREEPEVVTYELSSTIVRDAAFTDTSIFVVGPNRVGKSYLQRAIIAETIFCYPKARIGALDLQTTDFLGLQCSKNVKTLPYLEPDEHGVVPLIKHVPNTVTQVTVGKDEHMLLATESIKEVWSVYEERSEIRQAATRVGSEIPQFEPFRFFINEWNIFHKWTAGYGNSAKARKEFADEARARGIANPLYPLDAIARLSYIISSGGELKISICLSAQEHTEGSTGLPPQLMANTTVIAIGRIDEVKKMGGYSSVSLLVKDSHRIPDAATREKLREVVEKCIETRTPCLLTTLGSCAVGIIPDYLYLEKESAYDSYSKYNTII